MPELLLDAISKFLVCSRYDIGNALDNPRERASLESAFRGRKLRTIYANRSGERKYFTFECISVKGADKIPAYGGLKKVYNVSIVQHFYARHRIKLVYPYHQCMIHHLSNGTKRFYPIELLEVYNEENNEENATFHEELENREKFPKILGTKNEERCSEESYKHWSDISYTEDWIKNNNEIGDWSQVQQPSFNTQPRGCGLLPSPEILNQQDGHEIMDIYAQKAEKAKVISAYIWTQGKDLLWRRQQILLEI